MLVKGGIMASRRCLLTNASIHSRQAHAVGMVLIRVSGVGAGGLPGLMLHLRAKPCHEAGSVRKAFDWFLAGLLSHRSPFAPTLSPACVNVLVGNRLREPPHSESGTTSPTRRAAAVGSTLTTSKRRRALLVVTPRLR